jgi:hypothetical protein
MFFTFSQQLKTFGLGNVSAVTKRKLEKIIRKVMIKHVFVFFSDGTTHNHRLSIS